MTSAHSAGPLQVATSLLDYATYFDRHYLTRGLALYRSLLRHSPPFRLWVLCLDVETLDTVGRLNLEHVRLIALAELETAVPALLEVKPERHPVEYYWTCGPAFLVHLFDREPTIELLTYLDADLFFFGDPTPIYDELGDGSILLVEQRRSAAGARHSRSQSRFNVGLLIFRRSPSGLACVRLWREQCLEWCFNRVEPGRFGDQKYLDGWPSRFDVVVPQHRGVGVSSYNLSRYPIRGRAGAVRVGGDPLIFYHFSNLRVIADWLHDPGAWRVGERVIGAARYGIYVPYVRELRTAARLVRAIGGEVPRVDNLLLGRTTLRTMVQMMKHRSFLLVTDHLAL